MTAEYKPSARVTALADIVLTTGGGLCLLLVFYYLYYYDWTEQRQFTDPKALVFYCALPAVLATVLFASLRRQPLYKVRLALAVVSTGASAYFLETTAALFTYLPSVQAQKELQQKAESAQKLGIDFDTRTPLEIVADMRKEGISAYPRPDRFLRSEYGAGDELLPLGGVSNRPTVVCNEGFGHLIYESDERGFHNPKGLWTVGQIEIAALGDSYVQGFCVPPDKNFVSLIRKQYPNTLNTGIAAFGPLEMLAVVKEYLHFVKPRVVLWFYYEGNDLKDLDRARSSTLLMGYLRDGNQGLWNRQGEIDRVLAKYIAKEIEKGKLSRMLEELSEEFADTTELLLKLRGILKLARTRQALGLTFGQAEVNPEDAYRGPSDYTPELKHLFQQVLLETKNSVTRWGGSLYFVYLPTFRNDWTKVRKDRKETMELVRALEIPIIDIHQVFQSHSDPVGLFTLRMHNHYNIEGHRLVAEKVLESIASRSGAGGFIHGL